MKGASDLGSIVPPWIFETSTKLLGGFCPRMMFWSPRLFRSRSTMRGRLLNSCSHETAKLAAKMLLPTPPFPPTTATIYPAISLHLHPEVLLQIFRAFRGVLDDLGGDEDDELAPVLLVTLRAKQCEERARRRALIEAALGGVVRVVVGPDVGVGDAGDRGALARLHVKLGLDPV